MKRFGASSVAPIASEYSQVFTLRIWFSLFSLHVSYSFRYFSYSKCKNADYNDSSYAKSMITFKDIEQFRAISDDSLSSKHDVIYSKLEIDKN